jgi:prevent-host-death family protein
MLRTHERIITTQELAKQVQKAMANAKREPLVVTEEGRPAAYLISVELFDSLIAHLEALEEAELVTNIAIGERQFARGAYKTLEDARAIAESTWQEQLSGE